VRLRWPKSSADGNEQSNNECPSPAHLVVPKERNIYVIDNEIQRHAEYEQKDKTVDLSWLFPEWETLSSENARIN
jgi:hypothetical protein